MATVVRVHPIHRMANRVYNDTRRPVVNRHYHHSLALDARETEDAYVIDVEIPGLNPDHINVRIDGDELLISGQIAAPEIDEENTRVLLQERVYGEFSRRLRLPELVDRENVDATYENGILTLILPKMPEAQPKQIAVKVGNGN